MIHPIFHMFGAVLTSPLMYPVLALGLVGGCFRLAWSCMGVFKR